MTSAFRSDLSGFGPKHTAMLFGLHLYCQSNLDNTLWLEKPCGKQYAQTHAAFLKIFSNF